jgi:uncharacterized protein HemX
VVQFAKYEKPPKHEDLTMPNGEQPPKLQKTNPQTEAAENAASKKSTGIRVAIAVVLCVALLAAAVYFRN